MPVSTRQAISASERYRVANYVLRRRMAENYIPSAAMKRFVTESKKKDSLNVYELLPSELRHFHHLKKAKQNSFSRYKHVLSEQEFSVLNFSLGRDLYQAFEHARDSELDEDFVYLETAELFRRLIAMV